MRTILALWVNEGIVHSTFTNGAAEREMQPREEPAAGVRSGGKCLAGAQSETILHPPGIPSLGFCESLVLICLKRHVSGTAFNQKRVYEQSLNLP